jgi:pimeloyl-ACP methyl ester carboxylesterase
MPQAVVNDKIELEYEEIGSADHPTILLIMGFTAQLIAWPDRFCQMLVERGYHVVRFDNRDCGLSTKLDGQVVDVGALLAAALTGQEVAARPEVPYTLSDMAADAVGLLDHLGVERAHIVGASMGGMIAQHIAIEHPQRVLSLTSIMSTTGEPAYGIPTPEGAQLLLTPPPADRDGYIARAADAAVCSSKRYFDLELVRANAARAYDRSFYPAGASRQIGAVLASGSRAEGLSALQVPTLVIHGRDDTLVAPSGGLRTAELIPGAHLLLLADMGHDLPEPLWTTIGDALASHMAVAAAAAHV